MQNKNKITLVFTLFSVPLLIFASLILGASVLAEEEEQLVVVTLDSKKIAQKPLRFVQSQPEVAANLEAQEEVIDSLNADDQAEARTFSHVPVITASLTESEIDDLEKNELVENVEPEVIHRPELASSSAVIDTPEAYSLGFDGNGVAVAILDTGVDNDHSFLNVVSEACYSNAGGFGSGTTLCPGSATSSIASDSADTDQCTAASGCDHGTHVAGIAAGDGDGVSYTGVAKSADIIAIQVFTQFASGCGSEPAPCLGAYTSDIIAGLNRVRALHDDVGFTTPIAAANLSLGGGLYSSQTTCDAANASTKTAIDSLRSVGIASVIASGNEFSSTQISSPGCISTAVAVGSTTDSDVVSSFSNSNSMLDLWAPGSSITSSIIGDGNFGAKSGTSMATPQVAGAWAVIKEKNPDATVEDVLQALQESGTPVTDSGNSLTFSRIDLDDALGHANFTLISTQEIDVETSEAGDTATVRFRLAGAPTDDVTIPLSLDDASEGDLGGVSDVVITAATWNNPAANEVTITGVDDGSRDGSVDYLLITGDPSSSDGSYDALDADDVSDITLTNFDDEETIQGDLSGDTLGDVFSTWGNGWHIMAGDLTGTWNTLPQVSQSSLEHNEVGFGDFANGNGTVDVWAAWDNGWYYKDGGSGGWQFLTSSSQKLKDVAFCDFNGNNTTDVFANWGDGWYYKDGGQGSWVFLSESTYDVNKLNFGDFDGNGTCDAIAQWGSVIYVDYDSNGGWSTLTSSSANVRALQVCDINGNGSDDILYSWGAGLKIQWDGTGGWKSLDQTKVPVSQLVLGYFDNDTECDVLSTWGDGWKVKWSGTGTWDPVNSSNTEWNKIVSPGSV